MVEDDYRYTSMLEMSGIKAAAENRKLKTEIKKLRAGIRTAVLDIQDGYTKIALQNLKALDGGDDG